jgi:hypothetical protein
MCFIFPHKCHLAHGLVFGGKYKQGKDFINNWIKVEYQDGNTAFLADGNLLGWAGVFGGTKKILKVIQHLAQST